MSSLDHGPGNSPCRSVSDERVAPAGTDSKITEARFVKATSAHNSLPAFTITTVFDSNRRCPS